MHIDWFVFFAQIVNFLILVFLLKKLLYGRIIQAMDAREAKLKKTFDDAEQSRDEARKAAVEYEKKMQSLNDQYEALLNKARLDAETYRKELTDNARLEIERIQAQWIATVNAEREAFLLNLRRLAGAQIYAIARRVLRDLADEELEARIAGVLVDRIRGLDEEKKTKFRDSVRDGNKLIVQSGHEISPEARKKLDDVVRRFISTDIDLTYECQPDVVTGLELKTDGQKIAWSVDDYLNTLEENFIEALYAESQETKEQEINKGANA